jgi:arylsulfatase A-like enzyme
VADDLGYGETGVQGYATDIPTPNVDAIARNGVRFTQGYVSAPLCSPTRAGLMTGRYQQRLGHEFNPGPRAKAESAFGLPR